jgi:hypothetical protein
VLSNNLDIGLDIFSQCHLSVEPFLCNSPGDISHLESFSSWTLSSYVRR